MAYRWFAEEELFVVSWDAVVRYDIRSVLGIMAAHRETVASNLVFVGIIPKGAKLADMDTRVAFNNAAPQFDALCDVLYLVFQGEGFVAAAIRGVIAFLEMTSRRAKKPVLVGSLEEAARKAASPRHRYLLMKGAQRVREYGIELG